MKKSWKTKLRKLKLKKIPKSFFQTSSSEVICLIVLAIVNLTTDIDINTGYSNTFDTCLEVFIRVTLTLILYLWYMATLGDEKDERSKKDK